MAEQKEMETMESQETENIETEETKDTPELPQEECGTDSPPGPEEAEETSDSSLDGSSEEESGEEQPSEEAQAEEKKGFFKKKEKKNKQEEKIAELTDRVQRQMAEFDNFRKRTEKEKTQMYEIGAKSIIEKVLPVVDNFERGLAAVPDELKDDAFVDGMNKIYKQMMTMLEEVDVKPIEAVGKEFDPSLHNAVMQTESEEYESGIVAQELQKGYTYRDSVVRHSMVAVVS